MVDKETINETNGNGIDSETANAEEGILNNADNPNASQSVENEELKQSEESEEPVKSIDEEKKRKIRNIKRVSIVASSAVIVVALLWTVLTVVQGLSWRYVLTYTTETDGVTQTQRISADDFKLLIVYSEASMNPMQEAMDFLVNILTIEQAANARDLTLSEAELQDLRETAQRDLDFISTDLPQLNRVSVDFMERVHSFFYLMPKVVEGILDEVGFVVDEDAFAQELADYMVFMQLDYIDATLRYVITTSEELALEAKAALENGEMTFEEILMEFFYYNEIEQIEDIETMEELLEAYGLETIDEFIDMFHSTEFWELGSLPAHILSIEDINYLVSLEIGGTSNVIRFEEGMYVVFILDHIEIPPDDMIAMIHAEIEEMFTEMYLDDYRWDIFMDEFERWREAFEAGMTINQNALDRLDIAAILGF